MKLFVSFLFLCLSSLEKGKILFPSLPTSTAAGYESYHMTPPEEDGIYCFVDTETDTSKTLDKIMPGIDPSRFIGSAFEKHSCVSFAKMSLMILLPWIVLYCEQIFCKSWCQLSSLWLSYWKENETTSKTTQRIVSQVAMQNVLKPIAKPNLSWKHSKLMSTDSMELSKKMWT